MGHRKERKDSGDGKEGSKDCAIVQTITNDDDLEPKIPPEPRRVSGFSIDSAESNFMTDVQSACRCMNPTTGRGKKLHLTQMLLLPFIPIMALIVQNVVNLVTVLESQKEMQNTIEQVQLSTDLGNVTEALQSERAEIAFFLFTNGSVIRRKLSDHFEYTNQLIDNLKWPEFPIDDKLFLNKFLFRIRLDDFRDKIQKFDTPSIDVGIAFYNRANYIFLDQLTREIKEKDGSGVWRPLLAYKNMIHAIEHLGISMVFGEQYFGRGYLDQRSYIEFVTNDALGQDFLNSSQNFAYWIKYRYRHLQTFFPWYSNITRRRDEILLRRKIEPDFEKATEYFYAMLGYLEALKSIQYEIRYEVENTIRRGVRDLNSDVLIGLVLLLVVLVISPVIILLIRMVTKTLQAFSETLMSKTLELNNEKKRSDRLLYQMVPPPVAHQLRQRKQVSTEVHESVTVYFSDIIGFYELVCESSPQQVISLLNVIYKIYDSQIDCYDVYKIDTVGNAFMIASGLHMKKRDTSHAAEVAHMALDLLTGTENFIIPHMPGEKLKIRIGIHTGPIVSGVVGTKIPRYCLFGDTVSTASRLDWTGQPFKIHISSATRTALEPSKGGFFVVPRGDVEVHQNGPKMETFWLVGRHNKTKRPSEQTEQNSDVKSTGGKKKPSKSNKISHAE